MKIVVLDGFLVSYGGTGESLDRAFDDVTWYHESSPETIVERIGDAQAIFVNRAPITAQVFEQCPSLRFVGVCSTGYNHIDVEAARRAGVTVCNVPAYSAEAVAQHTMALLLEIACKISAHNQYTKDGQWRTLSDAPLAGRGAFELNGRTIGLVGYGSIARTVARMARGFGLRVLACRHPDREAAAADTPEGVRIVSFETLLSQSDIVSLHCPLNDATRGMICAENLAKMKQGAILLNTARGGLLNEADVAAALDNGQLSMAGLDVFAVEPPVSKESLAFHPCVVATPHVAWAPMETRRRLMEACTDNLIAFLNGTPQNVVS